MTMMAFVEVEPRGRSPIRIAAPLFLVWLFVLPGTVLGLPVITFVALQHRQVPALVIWRMLSLLAAMSGTQVDVDSPDARVRIRIH